MSARVHARSASSAWARWAPASPRCSPATASPSSASSRTTSALERGRAHLEHSTDRAVKRGKLTEDEQARLLDRITFTTDARGPRRRRPRHRGGPRAARPQAARSSASSTRSSRPTPILATNTSSLSVTEISVATTRPGRVVGMHFFNPAPVQKLVEVIRTVVTEPDVVDDVEALAARLGKNPVVSGDKAGFIANALLFGYLNHAVVDVRGHYATREDIDAAMRLGCGYPMGPLALLDLIGLDTAYEILDTMYKQGRDRLHAPAPILKQMVTAGLLGRKTGRGFYTYEAPDCPVVVADDADARRPTTQPQLRHDVTPGRRGRLRHDGHRHRRGLRQGRLRRRCTSPAAPRRSTGCAATIERSLDKAVQRGKLDRGGQGRGARPAHRHHRARRPRRRRPGGRGGRRGADVKKALFENLDEICKPGAILATTTSSLPVIELATATSAAAGRRRHALLQPGAGDEAGRGRLDGRRPPTTSPRPSRALCAEVGKHRGLLRRPGRLHRQRAAVPLPQRRGARCSRRTTPPPTTSTPR